MKYQPLLPTQMFSHIFSPFLNQRIGFALMYGNVGDWLIADAARQLFLKHNVSFVDIGFGNTVPDDVDEVVINGGGNMGTVICTSCYELRLEIASFGKPLTILPQTFNSIEPQSYKKVWVRENESKRFCPSAELGPDLALGYEPVIDIPEPTHDVGIWLRKDYEGCHQHACSLGDPVEMCETPEQYIELASRYAYVVTDRLHFAIASLIARRRVTLLKGEYFKNEAVWKTWLRDLGCDFRNEVPL